MSNNQEVMPFAQPELPAHLQNASNAGNEGVSSEDLAIPRLSLLQALSPQLDKTKPEYVKGAEPGQYHNSVTNEVMDGLYVINLFYKRTVSVFKKRDLGGGFQGNFETKTEALEELRSKGLQPDQYDLVDTANHYLLMLNNDGKPKGPAIFSMNGSKLRVSNKWNSQIMTEAPESPRFSTVWSLGSAVQSNNKGSWANTHVSFVGFASEELFKEAEEYYTALKESASNDADSTS